MLDVKSALLQTRDAWYHLGTKQELRMSWSLSGFNFDM